MVIIETSGETVYGQTNNSWDLQIILTQKLCFLWLPILQVYFT